MRRSLGPGMSAKSIPANSRIGGRDGGGVGTSVGLAMPGGPPMLGVGAEVGRAGSTGGLGRAIGPDGGVSLGAATGPQPATESTSTARRPVLTRGAYRCSGFVVRMLRAQSGRDTRFVE